MFSDRFCLGGIQSRYKITSTLFLDTKLSECLQNLFIYHYANSFSVGAKQRITYLYIM